VTRTVPPDSEIVQTGRDLGICFGDEPAGHFSADIVNPTP
jgi:6-phosphofructokinase 1